MLLKWLDGREATAAGAALADEFYLQSGSGLPRGRGKDTGQRPQQPELQKFLQKFLQRVDQAAAPLKLNVFKRAKLANSFKWRLLENGVEQEVVDELTQALVVRLTNRGLAASRDSAVPASRGRAAARTASQALHARANEALARRAYADALDCYQELVTLDPRDVVARNGLGITLAELARYKEAEFELRRAIGIRPSNPDVHFNLGNVLLAVGRYHEAEDPLRRALKLKPSYVDARVTLAMVLMLLGRMREARDSYEKALRLAPRNTQAQVGVGQVEALQGRFPEAEAAYRRALEAEPDASDALAALAWTRKMTLADAAWLERAEKIAAKLTPVDEATLRFAMGKYCDDVGDYAQAFRHYQRANELHRLRAEPYDREMRARFVDDLIRVHTPEALAQARAGAADSARPVFVVGMPRSGTSLVEQILASHPAARGAGELNFWTIAMRKHESTVRREILPELLRQKLAQDYLRTLAGHSPDAARVIDKMPVNSDYLGVIHSILPNARVIYLRRDPIDTCLSCYFQQFPPTLNFSMDLADLAHYYREHQRLVAHWRRVLPAETFLEVPYAELTADQEAWTRRILEFVGLPWDERCLDFHKTDRVVTTASTWQVRQRIYRSSIERWRHYEKFIGPLRTLKDLPA
jgi:tetratricopeptide (TPR) repeat protein